MIRLNVIKAGDSPPKLLSSSTYISLLDIDRQSSSSSYILLLDITNHHRSTPIRTGRSTVNMNRFLSAFIALLLLGLIACVQGGPETCTGELPRIPRCAVSRPDECLSLDENLLC